VGAVAQSWSEKAIGQVFKHRAWVCLTCRCDLNIAHNARHIQCYGVTCAGTPEAQTT